VVLVMRVMGLWWWWGWWWWWVEVVARADRRQIQ
jgi:hypothetical protein